MRGTSTGAAASHRRTRVVPILSTASARTPGAGRACLHGRGTDVLRDDDLPHPQRLALRGHDQAHDGLLGDGRYSGTRGRTAVRPIGGGSVDMGRCSCKSCALTSCRFIKHPRRPVYVWSYAHMPIRARRVNHQ